MINIAFLPLIMLAVIIGVVILVLNITSKHFPTLRRKERWLLPLYVTFLLACGIVLSILDPFEERQASGAEERMSIPSLYSYLQSGDTKEIDPEFIRQDWEFTYSAEELQITSSPSEELMAPIYVEKVAGMGDEVEVRYYETPTYMDGENLSEYIIPPDVNLSEGVLDIISSGEYGEHVVELNTFKDPFTFNQFTGRTFMGEANESPVRHGQNVVLIRVGEDKILDLDPDSYIEYVE